MLLEVQNTRILIEVMDGMQDKSARMGLGFSRLDSMSEQNLTTNHTHLIRMRFKRVGWSLVPLFPLCVTLQASAARPGALATDASRCRNASSYTTSTGPDSRDRHPRSRRRRSTLPELLRPANIRSNRSSLGRIPTIRRGPSTPHSTPEPPYGLVYCTDISATANRHFDAYIKGSHPPCPLATSPSNTTPPSSTTTGSQAPRDGGF
jgi:hypothetical protein